MRVSKPHIHQSIDTVMIGIRVVILLLPRSNTSGQKKKGLFTHLPNRQIGTFGDTDKNPVFPPQL